MHKRALFDMNRLPQDVMPVTPIDERLVAVFGASVYAVGGRVRDAFLNFMRGTQFESKDFDYVIEGRTFSDVQETLEREGFRVDLVGATFAVLKATLDGITVDVSLPRRERSTGQGHREFEVAFGPEVSVTEDQIRRDFTINMISVRLADRRVFAADGALEDLRAGHVRALSEQAFQDDPIRMLRAVQFASRFGFSLDPKTRLWISRNFHLIETSSAERVAEELVKLLAKSPVPSVGMRLLVALGLSGGVLPELDLCVGVEQNAWHAYDVFGHLMAALDQSARDGGDLIDRLAALLHDIGKPAAAAPRSDGKGFSFHGHEAVGAAMADTILRRLKFSDEIRTTVVSLVANHMFRTCQDNGAPLSDSAVRRLASRIGIDRIERQFKLRRADSLGSGIERTAELMAASALRARIEAMIDAQQAFALRDLQINGSDVIRILIEEGAVSAEFRGDRRVGDVLKTLLDAVLEDPAANQKGALEAMVRGFVQESTV